MNARVYIGGMSGLSLILLAGCGQSDPEGSVVGVPAAPVVYTSGISSTGPYQATGIKIGEITPSEAVIWTRLTRLPEQVGRDAPLPEFLYRVPGEGELQPAGPTLSSREGWVPVVIYPEGSSIETIRDAAVGSSGETRVLYRQAGGETWASTAWLPVEPDRDFTRQFKLAGLFPATDYELRVEGRALGSRVVASSILGQFGTAPEPDQPARIAFGAVTGTRQDEQDALGSTMDNPFGGFQIHAAMMDMDVDFFVHTGDILYYDRWAKNIDLARWGWGQMFGVPEIVDFHRTVPTYFMKDDHDTWQNDAYPTMESTFMGDFTYEEGIEVFREQVPIVAGDFAEGVTYRTFRWGQDVQFWLVEGRDYRDGNIDPDGPDKSIWGEEQMAWFKDTVEASDATFRLLISPTPLIGPDNEGKYDSHANEGWTYEGDELREFVSAQKNMIVITGDRHWQYVSVDDETGVREYGTGSATDAHAGGWRNDDIRPEHRYLNVIGGFLSVTVDRIDGVPTMEMRHHHVDGEILYEESLTVDTLAAR